MKGQPMTEKTTITVNGKKCEAVPVPEGITKPKELAVLFNCSYWAARGALRRGYYIVDYAKKTFNPASIDVDGAYRMAWAVYRRKFSNGRLPWFIDIKELVHEGAVAIWERGGDEGSERPSQMFYRAYGGMSNFIRRQQYLHRLSGDEDENSSREASEGHRDKPSPDTWRRAHRATEVMVKLIDARVSGHVPCYEPPEPEKWARQKADSQVAKERFLREILEAGEGITQAALARYLKVNHKTISKKTARLMKAGLIESVSGPAGQRGRALRLTAKGRALFSEPKLAA
jgi:hypothetical protein